MGRVATGVAGVGGVASAGLGTTAFVMWDRWLESQEKAAALLTLAQDKAATCEGLRIAIDLCEKHAETLEKLCGH